MEINYGLLALEGLVGGSFEQIFPEVQEEDSLDDTVMPDADSKTEVA